MTDDPRKWVRIYTDLARQIAEGKLKPGDFINRTVLATLYDVAPQTAAQALQQLGKDGAAKRFPGKGWQVVDKTHTPINIGCNHYHNPGHFGHCSEMLCRNYVNKCPLHSTIGSSTATCNIKRAQEVGYMSKETRDLAIKMIELNPAMEQAILSLIAAAYEDGRFDKEDEGT
jgi:hypothetical protein